MKKLFINWPMFIVVFLTTMIFATTGLAANANQSIGPQNNINGIDTVGQASQPAGTNHQISAENIFIMTTNRVDRQVSLFTVPTIQIESAVPMIEAWALIQNHTFYTANPTGKIDCNNPWAVAATNDDFYANNEAFYVTGTDIGEKNFDLVRLASSDDVFNLTGLTLEPFNGAVQENCSACHSGTKNTVISRLDFGNDDGQVNGAYASNYPSIDMKKTFLLGSQVAPLKMPSYMLTDAGFFIIVNAYRMNDADENTGSNNVANYGLGLRTIV